jgi:hypothetical protein
VSRGSRDEQECAQAPSYDGQVFENLAPQTTGHWPCHGGTTIIDSCRKACRPSPSNSKRGAYGA